MSSVTAPEIAVAGASSKRARHLVFPREHGAWGMLFVPLLTGAAVAISRAPHLLPLAPLVVAAFALFCLRTPVESLLKTSVIRARSEPERALAWQWAIAYSLTAAVTLITLAFLGYSRGLAILGGAAASAFVLQLLLRKLGRRTRALAQIMGAGGLATTAPAAYLVVTGRIDTTALVLWAANWIFAGNQVHYVQVRLHGAHLRGLWEKLQSAPVFFAGQFAFIFAIDAAAVTGYLPVISAAAFVPVVYRSFRWYFEAPSPLDVRRLGFTELAHALTFGIVLSAGFILRA